MRVQVLRIFLAGVMLPALCFGQSHGPYLGFDKNLYPGDELLPELHRTFAFTGYWLNNPPGMNSNPWAGKRAQVRAAGFGFLVLFNGRLNAELKDKDAAALGRSDAIAAIEAGRREGFPKKSIIFLDQEEGGHLLAEQAAYVGAWVEAMSESDYRPGVYCSGIAVSDGAGRVTTAEEIAQRFATTKKKPALWVVNDQCPPAPGCVAKPASSAQSGQENALVWQFARSPRSEFAAGCARSYASDQNCYAPGLPHSEKSFVDLNASRSADPSQAR